MPEYRLKTPALARKVIGPVSYTHLRRSEVKTALLYLLRPHAVGQISAVTLVPALLPTVRAHADIVLHDFYIQNSH